MIRKWIYLTILSISVLIFVYFKWTSKATSPSNYAAQIKSSRLKEVSGIVFSVKNKDLLWMHNDGGRGKRFYLVDRSGNTKATFKLEESLRDWEDIAIGPGAIKGKPYIYAGDIGDNSSRRPFISIYRFLEPILEDDRDVKDVEKLTVKYPDGSRDAEAMFVDPLSKNLYIITKREDNVGVYYTPTNFNEGDTVTLKKGGVLHIKGIKMLGWVTAADISRDGKRILVRTYSNVFYWDREDGQTVEEAMQGEPKILTHIAEVQGEAIGFTPNGKGYYTVREGRNPYLNHNSISR